MFRAPQWHGATQTHFPPRPRKSQWQCDITNVVSPHGLSKHYKQTYRVIPPIIPLTSGTPRLHQYVSCSPVARRHANTLPTKAAQIPMAVRHHERSFATWSVQTLQANVSRDTTNHPAHQRHAALTPACFALPNGTAPRKHTSHQGHANPNGTATSRTNFLQKSRAQSPKRAFRTRLPPKVTCQVSKTSVSYETASKSHTSTSVSYETSSKSRASSLEDERFVRDFLKNSHVKVCKTSVSYETSSKSEAETPIGVHTSRIPAKQFRDSSPPNNTRSHANPNVTATFTSTTTHNLTIPCACHESVRVHTSNAHEMSPPSHLATSRFPAPATKIALPHLKTRTKYCACHEK